MTVNWNDVKDCFYNPKTKTVIDCIDPATGRGIYGRDLDSAKSDYGDNVIITDFDTAVKEINESYKSEPVEIDKAKFWEMLEILPPLGWVNNGDTESFKMCEMLSGNITGIYCRLGDRYFSFNDTVSLKHTDIVEKCHDKFYG